MGLKQAVLLTSTDMVENFIEINGLPPFARDILFTAKDCEDFNESFFDVKKEMCDCLMAFKKHRIANSSMTLDKFLKLCYTGKTNEAFEQTFFQKFSEEEIAKVKNSFINGKVTLHEIYERFEKNPNRNIMRYFNR